MTNTGSGPVQHAEQDYLFFWAPSGYSYPSGYVTGMQAFLSGLQAGDYSTGHTATSVGNPLSVTQQYYDNSGPGGAKRFIPLAIQNAGTIMDTDSYPANSGDGQTCTDDFSGNGHTYTPTTCLTAADLGTEVTSYIAANHYPTGPNVEYFVLTPPGVGSCDAAGSTGCAMSSYCAWHTYANTGATQTTFANMPYLDQTPCDVGHYLNNDGTDSVVGTFSHELAETMTDPLLNAWQGAGGGGDEIGDKCAYQYVVGDTTLLDTTGLPTQTPSGTDYYNTTLNGRNYLLQMEFDNSANTGTGGCNQWDTQTQPKASISAPSPVTAGTSTAFSLASVNAPAGVAYVSWNFGDGATGTSTGTAPIHHTYAVAGSRTVTAILTDKHGNEVKETKAITVKTLVASVAIGLSTTHPAPGGGYTVKLTGEALPGGVFGASHNRSEVDLFEQSLSPACASTRSGELSRVAAGKATKADSAFVAAGAFALSQARKALPGHNQSIRFCGYVSRTASLTDAHATTSYTTT
jgi:hypothetical protein